MADFTGNTLTATAVYGSTTKTITITDTTDYVGQGLTRTDADILMYPFHKPSTGDVTYTVVPDSSDPTIVSSWTLTLGSSDRDGWYQFNIVYAFDFAALATHSYGDVVRDSGTYYIYYDTTASSAPITDTSKWRTISSYEDFAKLQTNPDILITRLSEDKRFELQNQYIESDDSIADVATSVVKADVYLEAAQTWFTIGNKLKAQELIEGIENLTATY